MKLNVLLLAGVLLASACDSGTRATGEVKEVLRITGTVTYRERILLRPGSRLEVILEDVSRADAPAVQLARLERTDPGQVPISFELEYQHGEIDPRMSYAIRARILGPDGDLLFMNDTHTPVITRDIGNRQDIGVDILLVSTQRKGPGGGEPDGGGEPAGLELRGQFSYMADATNFRDCNTGKIFPVEMSGQYIELERAYLNSGKEPGSELTVDLVGRFLERPGMGGNSSIIMLIVDEFKQISENQDCVPLHHAELFNTYWKLIELKGKPVLSDPSAGQQREAHMELNGTERRINGHGGCNRFFGQFTLEGDKLAFTGLGSTMMACPAGMEDEQAFLLALGETNRAEVSGLFLQLFKDDQILARFEAIHF